MRKADFFIDITFNPCEFLLASPFNMDNTSDRKITLECIYKNTVLGEEVSLDQ